MGRRLKFTVDDVQSLIDYYFATTKKYEYTVTGIAMLFGTKQLMYDYEKLPGFSEIIRAAKLRVENDYEICMKIKGGAGNIFALKNFGWTDQPPQSEKNGDYAAAFEKLIDKLPG